MLDIIQPRACTTFKAGEEDRTTADRCVGLGQDFRTLLGNGVGVLVGIREADGGDRGDAGCFDIVMVERESNVRPGLGWGQM